VIEPSDDPPRFSNIRVDPYDSWLLPVCCLTHAKAYLQDHRRRGDGPAVSWPLVSVAIRYPCPLISVCHGPSTNRGSCLVTDASGGPARSRLGTGAASTKCSPWATPFGPRLELSVGPGVGQTPHLLQYIWGLAPDVAAARLRPLSVAHAATLYEQGGTRMGLDACCNRNKRFDQRRSTRARPQRPSRSARRRTTQGSLPSLPAITMRVPVFGPTGVAARPGDSRLRRLVE
jgi:hypothetical protein